MLTQFYDNVVATAAAERALACDVTGTPYTSMHTCLMLHVDVAPQPLISALSFPNASTPWTNNHSIKVPSFACSKPLKPGCLFNVTADPTEHTDLALEMPEVFASMLARPRNITKTRFDPNRGPGDPKACVQMRKNKGPNPESKTGPDPGFIGFSGPLKKINGLGKAI